MQTQIVKYNFPLSGMPQKASDMLTKEGIKNAHDKDMGTAVVVELSDTDHSNKVADIAIICGGFPENGDPTYQDLEKLNGSK